MDHRKAIRLYFDFVVPSYARTPLVMERGKGVHVWDVNGEEYLDFFPGWAVSGIGHCHKAVVEAVREQAQKLLHVSNNYYHGQQGLLAQKIIEHSFPGKVFFCNSGAEANEAAFKLVRKFANPSRNEIISMEGSFHGRTYAALSATGQERPKKGFEPLSPGFKSVAFNDWEALKGAVSGKTAAILVEPIQGEGGVRPADDSYLKQVRRLCDEKKILLIFDEVQTGMGRTGRMFCYQNYGVEPDVMTLAKSLGGGFPIGALVVKKAFADLLQPGSHASTFGGGPLACAAALAVFEAIEKEKLLKNAVLTGSYLMKRLKELQKKYPVVKEVRGMALMAAMELGVDAKAVVETCYKKKLLINCTQGNVLRLMPPLVVKERDIDQAMVILEEALKTQQKVSETKGNIKEGVNLHE